MSNRNVVRNKGDRALAGKGNRLPGKHPGQSQGKLRFKFDRKVVAVKGAIFSPNDGLEYPESAHQPGLPAGRGKRRMVACPPTGARMVGVHASVLQPGEKTVVHSHPLSEEVIVFVRGKAKVTLGKKRYEVGPGWVLYAPPGVPHGGLEVLGNEEFECVGVQSPPDTRMYRLAGYDF